jgi:hypothetical protein
VGGAERAAVRAARGERHRERVRADEKFFFSRFSSPPRLGHDVIKPRRSTFATTDNFSLFD